MADNERAAIERKPVFPYVVIRWMAAVYGRRQVGKSKAESNRSESGYLLHDRFWSDPTTLTEEGKTLLIEMVSEDVVESRFRMCVVFSKEESVYLEPDGSENTSIDPPSGGIRLDAVKVTGQN